MVEHRHGIARRNNRVCVDGCNNKAVTIPHRDLTTKRIVHHATPHVSIARTADASHKALVLYRASP